MDAMDEEIIRILRKDSRESYVNIAERLNTSEGTVRTRIKKLYESGIITQFTIRTKGKNVKALVEISIDVNVDTSLVARNIMGIEGVELVYEVSGENDLVVIIDVMSTTELNEIIDKIRGFGNIQSTKTSLILNEHTE